MAKRNNEGDIIAQAVFFTLLILVVGFVIYQLGTVVSSFVNRSITSSRVIEHVCESAALKRDTDAFASYMDADCRIFGRYKTNER